MKKYLYLALASLAVLVSCKRETAPAVETQEEETQVTTEAKTPVEFTSNLLQNIQTKSAIGALDHWNADQQLFIYGIARQGLNAEATEERDLDLTAGGILIYNVKAEPFGETAGFNLNTVTHQPIKVLNVTDPGNPGDPTAEPPVDPVPATKESFYYQENRRYEFFGYYVDDATVATAIDANTGYPAPTVGTDGITLGIQINGSQDIMLATTDHDDDNIEGLNPNRLYSAYAARKGVHPNLVFKHMLSRFNVYVKSGDDATTAADVTLTTVEVETNDAGTLNIAHKAHVANKPDMVITPKNPSEKNLATGELTPSANNPQPFIGVWNAAFDKQLSTNPDIEDGKQFTLQMTTAWQQAGTIMVMPEKDEYMLKLGIKQVGYMGGEQETISYYPITFENIVQPKDDAKGVYNTVPDVELDHAAVAGHAYDVNVIIYGLQKVKIEVTMTEWDQNGSFNLDPDSDYEYKLNLGADEAHNKANPLAMQVDDTHQIEATATPELANGAAFSYKSKDPGIATVSETGLITAVAPGLVRIDVYVPAYDAAAGVGDPKRPEGGYTAMWVQVSGGEYTVTPAESIVAYIGEDPVDLSTFLTIKEGETVVNPAVTFTVAAASAAKASIDDTDHKTLTLLTTTNNDAITINYSIAADDVHHYLAKDGSFTLTAKAQSQYGVTVADATDCVITIGGAALNLSTLLTVKEGEETVTPAVTFAIGGGYEFAAIAGTTLSLLDGANKNDAITVNYSIPADAANHYAAKDGSFNVTVQGAPITVNAAAAVVNKTFGDADFDLGDATASVDGATITYEVTAGGAYLTKVSDKTFHIAGAGQATITITAHKDGNYVDGTATVTVNIAKANPTITVGATLALNLGGDPNPASASLGATVTDGAGALSYEVTAGSDYATVNAAGDVTAVAAGEATVTITAAENANFNQAATTVTVTVSE